VILVAKPETMPTVQSIGNLYLPSQTSSTGQVPLAAIAQIQIVKSPLVISHLAQFPAVTISFNLAPGVALGEAVEKIQQMQEQLINAQQELADTEVSGTAGGGLVTARVNGQGELVDLTIAPAAIDADDLEETAQTIADLVLAAVRDAYARAREWMDAALDAVRPGVSTDTVARTLPRARDFGFDSELAAFGLQFAHGLGLGLHERPVISRLNSLEHPIEIQAGMVFAMETYCPAADGISAARIEEEVVVTDYGTEILTRFPAIDLPIASRY